SDTTSPIGGFLMTSELINLQFLRGIIASILTFFLNMFLIVIVYQGMQNILSKIPIWVNVSIALIIALWMDSILYNLLANLGTPNFQLLLPGDVLAKTLSALVISPILSYYLIALAPKLPSFRGNEKRPTFDVLFGVFGGVKKTLALLQQQMSEQEQALILARERVTMLQDM
ncbi:MAG TPA: hypothetical protein PLZ51_09870, partial [Aggregatilineales bacterium]|nr:hypothetical protein [Aggregatilineales bacterium]